MLNTDEEIVIDPEEPSDEEIEKAASGSDDDTVLSPNSLSDVVVLKEGLEDAAQFSDPIASPAVLGEEDPFSGDATSGEAVDIDKELDLIGEKGDYTVDGNEDGIPEPLGTKKSY